MNELTLSVTADQSAELKASVKKLANNMISGVSNEAAVKRHKKVVEAAAWIIYIGVAQAGGFISPDDARNTVAGMVQTEIVKIMERAERARAKNLQAKYAQCDAMFEKSMDVLYGPRA